MLDVYQLGVIPAPHCRWIATALPATFAPACLPASLAVLIFGLTFYAAILYIS